MAQMDVKILSITETFGQGPSGTPQPLVVVTFKVGTFGPFSETFPKAGFDPAGANVRLREFANKLGLIGGV
jgi:hypothetical protein